MKKFIYIITLLLPFLYSCERPHEQIVEAFEANTTIFIDKADSLLIKDIIKPETLSSFTKENLNLGLVQHTAWVRVKLPRELLTTIEYLQIARSRALIDSLFLFDGTKITPLKFKGGIPNVVQLNSCMVGKDLIFKSWKNGYPVSIYYSAFSKISEFSNRVQNYQFSLVLMIILTSIIIFYATLKLLLRRKIFYVYFILIFLGYIIFYCYDYGHAQLWINKDTSGFAALFANGLYNLTVIPLALSLMKDWNLKHGNKVAILISLGMGLIIWFYFTNLFYAIYLLVAIALIFSVGLIAFSIFSFNTWSKNRVDRVFMFAMLWILLLPALKASQNLGIAEGWIFEVSFIFFIILQSFTWAIYFILEASEEQKQKLTLIKEHQQLQENLKLELVHGQVIEQNTIGTQLKNEIAPVINTIQNLAINNVAHSKKELDTLVEKIRYLSRMYISPDLENSDLESELKRFIGLIQTIKPIHIILDFNMPYVHKRDKYLLNCIYRAVQEAINNSLTYGKANTIIVQVLGGADLIAINIEDNSKIDEETMNESQGLKDIRSRLGDYKYEMKLSNQSQQGVRLEIELFDLEQIDI